VGDGAAAAGAAFNRERSECGRWDLKFDGGGGDKKRHLLDVSAVCSRFLFPRRAGAFFLRYSAHIINSHIFYLYKYFGMIESVLKFIESVIKNTSLLIGISHHTERKNN
jgi:hypothetical protein